MFGRDQSIEQRTQAWHQATGQPVSELVPWLFSLDDFIIVQKDGSLLANFELAGIDFDSTQASSVNALRSQVLYAVKPLQDLPITLWWQVRRRAAAPLDEIAFPDPISQAIYDEQRLEFERNPHFINFHTLSISMEPPAGSSKLLSRIARANQNSQGSGLGATVNAALQALKDTLLGNSDFPHESHEDLVEAIDQFKKVISNLASALISAGLKPLKGTALAGFLTMCASPSRDFQERLLPLDTQFWDSAFSNDSIGCESRDYLDVQGFQRAFLGAISLNLAKRGEELPLKLDMFADLLAAPVAFTFTQVFRFQASAQGAALIAKFQRYHKVRKYPLKSFLGAALNGGVINEDSANEVRSKLASQAQALQDAVSVGQTGAGLYYGGLIVHAASLKQLEQDMERIEQVLNTCQLSPIRETLHKVSTLAATIPGSWSEIARWSLIETVNMVDLSPLLTISKGEPTCEYLTQELKVPCHALLVLPTRQRTLYHFTGYVGDVGHVLILGGTGTGKTTFALICASAFRQYPNARVLCFDKNYSARPAILLQGGRYIDLNPEAVTQGRSKMNPIRGLFEGPNPAQHIGFLVGWVELLVKQRGYQPTAQDRLDLERSFNSTLQMGQPRFFRLSSVIANLNSQGLLAQNLMPWIAGQSNGDYFDNEEDHFAVDQFVGIENGTILQNEELSLPYISQAFYRIAVALRANLQDQSSLGIIPTFIYIPELRYFLRNAEFEAQLGEMLTTLRKLGVRIFFDTQSPDQLVESKEFAAFRDNVPTVVFAPNPNATSGSLAKIYKDEFALNDGDLAFIAGGIPKQDYFLKSGDQRRRVTLKLTPRQMAYLRSDAAAQRALEKHYFTAAGFGQPGWEQRYLDELLRANP